MGSIQLGIEHNSKEEGHVSKPRGDISMQDYMAVDTTIFPSGGSNYTPAHRYPTFIFKKYAPIIFHYFRGLFNIREDEYIIPFCNSPLHEVSNPGASGSLFYRTQNDEFIMKTVQHKECDFLQKLLPGFYIYYNYNPRTLLTKLLGLYSYQCNSTNIRLVAMKNLLPSNIKMHQKYDLKGSTYKRKASKNEKQKRAPTFKDLDFKEHYPDGIILNPDTYSTLLKTIQSDCLFLQSNKIIDYSLLVGIHNIDLAQKDKEVERVARLNKTMEKDVDTLSETSTLSQTTDDYGSGAYSYSTSTESNQIDTETSSDEDYTFPTGGILARSVRGDRLLLFVGIIDILQSYGLKKKLESWWKSTIHDGKTVSVREPVFYATRFVDYMKKDVFKKGV